MSANSRRRPLEPHDILGRRLAVERRKKGWTAARLAEETERLGHPISRSTIAKIEAKSRGRVGVTVDEAVVLAVALDVPLALLFLPTTDIHDVALTPTISVGPWRFYLWSKGESPLNEERISTWRQGAGPIIAWENYSTAFDQASHAHREVRAAERIGDSDQMSAAQTFYVTALRELTMYATYLRDRADVPAQQLLPDPFKSDMADLNLIRPEEW